MRLIQRKRLLFLAFLVFFVLMKTDDIIAILSETDWNACYTLTLAELCRSFGADPRMVDNFMYDAFGMSGDDIIDQYRRGPMIF